MALMCPNLCQGHSRIRFLMIQSVFEILNFSIFLLSLCVNLYFLSYHKIILYINQDVLFMMSIDILYVDSFNGRNHKEIKLVMNQSRFVILLNIEASIIQPSYILYFLIFISSIHHQQCHKGMKIQYFVPAAVKVVTHNESAAILFLMGLEYIKTKVMMQIRYILCILLIIYQRLTPGI